MEYEHIYTGNHQPLNHFWILGHFIIEIIWGNNDGSEIRPEIAVQKKHAPVIYVGSTLVKIREMFYRLGRGASNENWCRRCKDAAGKCFIDWAEEHLMKIRVDTARMQLYYPQLRSFNSLGIQIKYITNIGHIYSQSSQIQSVEQKTR